MPNSNSSYSLGFTSGGGSIYNQPLRRGSLDILEGILRLHGLGLDIRRIGRPESCSTWRLEIQVMLRRFDIGFFLLLFCVSMMSDLSASLGYDALGMVMTVTKLYQERWGKEKVWWLQCLVSCCTLRVYFSDCTCTRLSSSCIGPQLPETVIINRSHV
jgi:hypothetical protein